MHHKARCYCAVATLLSSCAAFSPAATAEDTRGANDCGVNCVYLMLNLCSRRVGFTELRRSLPRPSNRGLSMEELRGAASEFGLSLRGAFLTSRDVPLDRPAIAFLEAESKGHFVVLTPIGETGTMVMLLDFPRPPQILDYSRLISSTGWTGRVLVPSWRYEWAAPRLLGMALAVLTLSLFAKKPLPMLAQVLRLMRLR